MEEASLGVGGYLCAAGAIIFIIIFFPFSLFYTIKVSAHPSRNCPSQPLAL